jgi:hypothetical protein
MRIINNKSNRKENTFFLCPISQRYTLVHLVFSIKVDRYKKQDGRVCNYSDVTASGLSRQAHVCRHANIIWRSRGIEWPPIQKCVRLHEFNAAGVLLLRKQCWCFLTHDRSFIWTDGETAACLMFIWESSFTLRWKGALQKLVAGYQRFQKQVFFLDDGRLIFSETLVTT